MAKQKKTKNTGEQMPLIDVGPENTKAIIAEVRVYKKHQADRLAALEKEIKQKAKIKALVQAANLHRLKDGTIKFTVENTTITLTPRDELIQIKEKRERKKKADKKKGTQKTVEQEEADHETKTK